jgi:hypothetical protein
LNIPEESLQEALQQQSEFAHPRDPLVEKIVTLMATRDDWQGSATKLQLELDLSTAPNHLSRQLKEAQTRLNEEGIEIVFPPRQQIGQLIRLSKLHAITEGPVIMPPKIDHQIVISQENQAETMTLSAQTDRHTDTPAADTAASTEFSAGAVAGEMEPGARTIQAASSPSAVTARSTVTEPDPGFCGRQPGG